tara:strand:- start:310 stop:894 length:585 start_codon:yes stop_codon:yes gene_type:complete
MFLAITNCFLLKNNRDTCKSEYFDKFCVVIFYFLSIAEMLLVISIDKIKNNYKDNKFIQLITFDFVPFVLLGVDMLVNGILLISILKIAFYESNNISVQDNIQIFESKLFKVQTNDIESGEIELTDNNDENHECPICYEKSDEYYIYHFFDKLPDEKKYKPGCLKYSHFICKNCASNKLINLNKCVLCNEYYNG